MMTDDHADAISAPQAAALVEALAFFLFRLLSKLRPLGSVPAIDRAAYTGALED